MKKQTAPQRGKYFNLLSYLLSRFAFLGTHVVLLFWLSFLLNDPFNLGTNTLDFKVTKPPGTCTPYIVDNIKYDLILFAGWWASHSIFARKRVKVALGLWEDPKERPLFAAIATVSWGINVFFWKPITDCAKWDPLAVDPYKWLASGIVIVLGCVIVLGFLWKLPDHVFGTAKYQYPPGQFPKGKILRDFPYGLVRHPAATGFLWVYWALPAYTPNHIFLASLWTIFIVVGTLVFEEGGLKGNDEFGRRYEQYRKEVPAFCPYPGAVLKLLGGKKTT